MSEQLLTGQLLTGWGRTQRSRAVVRVPADAAQVAAAVHEAGSRGVLVRGAGRSYGDAALNSGGTVLDLSRLDEVHLDGETADVGAGVRLSVLIARLLEVGRFVPVTPGTAHVSVGGMVAADVHGKNHHADGSFGAHLESLELVTASGTVRRVGPAATAPDRELFLATVGGMGLTGAITRVRLRTCSLPGPWLEVVTTRHDDLESVMAAQVAADATHRYSVAWLDSTATGRALGRGVLSAGDHTIGPGRPHRYDPGPGIGVPVPPPFSLLGRGTVAALNSLRFGRAPRRSVGVQDVRRFFHPLDALGHWNRAYGPAGLVQYQVALPEAAADLLPHLLRRLQSIGAASYVSVLKRFGPGNDAPLSFPMAGWTLALDLPAAVPGLPRLLDSLDARVVAAGGRCYLAKDSRTAPDVLAAMYPGLPGWRATVAAHDPERVFRSDLARRVGL